MNATLEIIGIKKHFTGTKALDWEDSDRIVLESGNIYALLGENGAGKSTLAKILAGIHTITGGEVKLDGVPFSPKNSKEARNLGVGIVLQEPGLIPSLRIFENLLMGEEQNYCVGKIYQLSKMRKVSRQMVSHVCPDIDVNAFVRDLTLEDQKMVEVARATHTWPKVLLIDETSAALSRKNVDCLFSTMRSASENGSIVLFITHRMEEVFDMCNKVIVLKDGKLVGMKDTIHTDIDELSRMMVGRAVTLTGIHKKKSAGEINKSETILELKDFGYEDVFSGISLQVKRGQIVGIGGLAGGGKEDILPAIFGDKKKTSGTLLLFGREETALDPAKSIKKGVAYIPKEREKEGLILRHSISANIVLPSLGELTKLHFFVNPKIYDIIGKKFARILKVKCNSTNDLVDSLSGGNRQKVVVARWLSRNARLILMDNPTRGIDVASRAEIYQLIEEMTQNGVGILLVTDDMPELISLCDEIFVMRHGQISKHFEIDEEVSEQDVVRYMI